MAEEKRPEPRGEEAGESKDKTGAPKKSVNLQSWLVLGNTALVLAAAGTLVYTKILFQRPVIDESTEIKRRKEELKTPAPITDRPLMTFDPVTVNIATTSGKSHYATVTFSVECRDAEASAGAGAKKTQILDLVIASLAKRQMTELNTIQGKLLLKSELIRSFNGLVSPGAIVEIYFSNFVLQ